MTKTLAAHEIIKRNIDEKPEMAVFTKTLVNDMLKKKETKSGNHPKVNGWCPRKDMKRCCELYPTELEYKIGKENGLGEAAIHRIKAQRSLL